MVYLEGHKSLLCVRLISRRPLPGVLNRISKLSTSTYTHSHPAMSQEQQAALALTTSGDQLQRSGSIGPSRATSPDSSGTITTAQPYIRPSKSNKDKRRAGSSSDSAVEPTSGNFVPQTFTSPAVGQSSNPLSSHQNPDTLYQTQGWVTPFDNTPPFDPSGFHKTMDVKELEHQFAVQKEENEQLKQMIFRLERKLDSRPPSRSSKTSQTRKPRREPSHQGFGKYPPSEPSDPSSGSSDDEVGLGRYSHHKHPDRPRRIPIIDNDNSIKAAPPDYFNGTTPKLREWIRQVENYFIMQSSKFRDEQIKVLFALTYIRGGQAEPWARFVNETLLAYRNREKYDPAFLCTKWSDLKKALKEGYGERFEKEAAREALKRLRQGNDPLQNYTQVFAQHMRDADLPQDQLVQRYIRGINGKIWEIIRLKEIPQNDLGKVITMCLKAEENVHIREQMERSRQYTPSSSTTAQFMPRLHQNPPPKPTQFQRVPHARLPPPVQPRPAPQPTPAPKPRGWGDPMDVDRMKGKQREGSKVQCYRCRGFGHFAKNCPIQHARSMEELDKDTINRIVQFHLQEPIQEEPEPGPSSVPEDTPSHSHDTQSGLPSYFYEDNDRGPQSDSDDEPGPSNQGFLGGFR